MKDNPLLKYKITSHENLIDTYRISDNFKNKITSPYDIININDSSHTYYTNKNMAEKLVRSIDPSKLIVDDKNIFVYTSSHNLLSIYIQKSLDKNPYSTYSINNGNSMYCSKSELDACNSLPLIINHHCNIIAVSTKISPGNTVFVNPENIQYLSYDSVTFPKVIGCVGTINGNISVYSYHEIPKDKIIVSLLSDDYKTNLFQVINDKIVFMENDINTFGNFFDSISIIDIVDENIEENNSNEFDTITLKGITYKLVPVEGE